ERFRLARAELLEPVEAETDIDDDQPAEIVASTPSVARIVDAAGRISIGGHRYHAGRWLALETVDVVSRDGLIELFHRGVLVAAHARRHPPAKEPMVLRRQGRRARVPSRSVAVIRKVDTSGS